MSRWPWLAAACCFLLYVAVGVWLVKSVGYLIYDSASRTITAQTMVLSRDPHLGVMGFYWPPVPMLIRIPFVLVLAPFGQSILAGPISSAIAVASTLPVLAKIGDELLLNDRTTRLFALLFALNPVTIFMAANGMSEATFVLILALTCLGYVRYVERGTVESIALMGLSLGLGMACRVEFVPITIATVIGCALNTPRDRVRPVASLVALPPCTVFAVWSLGSLLWLGHPFFWYTNDQVVAATPAVHPWMPAVLSSSAILGYVIVTALVIAPALVLALVVGARQRGDRRAWLGLTAISVTLPLLLALQLLMRDTFGAPRALTPLVVFSAVASMWTVARGRSSTSSARSAVAVLLALTSVVGGVAATVRFASHRHSYAEGEYAFFAPLLGRDSNVAEATGPSRGYVGDLSLYADLRDDLDPFLGSGRFVAMDSLQAVSLLETRYPKQFIIPENRDFEEILSDPADRFDFILVQPASARNADSDLLGGELIRSDGGRWTQVGDYGGLVTVYEWVPDGGSPTFHQRSGAAQAG